jgi:ABC-2 type transport system ATP-binding protein
MPGVHGMSAAAAAPAIHVAGLCKTYRYHKKDPGVAGSIRSLFRRRTLEARAVEDVSFTIRPGEVVGFLGPNGAGKTTTLKMLSGLLHPSVGHLSVLGHQPWRREHAFLRRISLIMGQRSMLWWDLPAMETLLLHKHMYGIPDAEFRRTVDELASLLEVEELLRVQVRKLSLGERMKMELMASLVHGPELLFLDEPTIGLDVVAQQRVRGFLRRLNAEHGTTIVLTSHYMADVEALCPRVLLIHRGRLRYDGPLAALAQRSGATKRVRAVFAEAVAPATLATAPPGLTPQPGEDPLRLSFEVPREHVPAAAGWLLTLGRVVDLSVQDPPVEDVLGHIFATAMADVPADAPDHVPAEGGAQDVEVAS